MNQPLQYRDILANAFRADVSVPIADEAIDALLAAAEVLRCRKKQVIVEEWSVDRDLYITVKGVTRVAYHEGDKEVTFGFGAEGSVFLSPLGYVRNMPAYFSLIAVTDCLMLKVSQSKVDELARTRHDVAYWLLNLALAQFYNLEFKLRHSQDQAKQRYKDLVKRKDVEVYSNHKIRHVDIASVASDRVIASYLGIIPTHLSNIKKEIIEEEKENADSSDEK